MKQKRANREHLKVLEGKGTDVRRTAGAGKKNIYYLLLFLSLFLLIQILCGWIWGSAGQDTINTVLASEGTTDVSFSAGGIITFSEKVVLAPCSGFVCYEVTGGERVPVGKELASITDFPLKKADSEESESSDAEYFQRVKDWLLGETEEEPTNFFPANNKEMKIVAPLPGLVHLKMDGFEIFGPNSRFPYLTPEEFAEKGIEEKLLSSGERVLRSTPLLKLIDNYYWFFSAVLLPELGRLLPENQQENKLFFSFAPDIPVQGRKVESRERDDGTLEITWCIDRELPGLYEQRWDNAEIVYKKLEGALIPKSALVQKEDKKGVYVVEEGLIKFREVIVLTERENDYLVKNLEIYERVVTKPENVREGQSFFW
jgi:putative membrane fusion protein